MNMNGEIKEQGGTHFDPCSSSRIVAAPSDDAALYDAALYAAYSDGRQDERADALLLRLPEPYGQVTTHSQTGQQFFYRWPEQPYLDNASKCVTVYATPSAVSESTAPVDARDALIGEINNLAYHGTMYLSERESGNVRLCFADIISKIESHRDSIARQAAAPAGGKK